MRSGDLITTLVLLALALPSSPAHAGSVVTAQYDLDHTANLNKVR